MKKKTKELLINFIKSNTSLETVDMGTYFYAVKRGSGRTIAFRADMDAVKTNDGARHLCGHDGHSASLAGFALVLDSLKTDNTVYLIFQPAEETGEGGPVCSNLISEKKIDEVYAFHNIPGYDTGKVLLRKGTFACASTGIELSFEGKPAHAAYPENGINPAAAISEVVIYASERIRNKTDGMILATVIGIESGSSSYGVSASEGTLRMTLRGEKGNEFEELKNDILKVSQHAAEKYGLRLTIEEREPFPATENSELCNEKIKYAAEKSGTEYMYLEEPFRWSEDFGYYTKKTSGAMFGIGNGIDAPNIHTEEYEFRNEVMRSAILIFMNLIDQ